MSPEEREEQQEQEIISLREQLAQRDDLIKQMQEQITALSERVQDLEAQLVKNSRNSHLPPSSDRFVRQPKSLRKKSGKKPGGQEGHPGKTLLFSSTPDEVVSYSLDQCSHCQEHLQEVPACGVERRQVLDLPAPRVVVVEHQAVQKRCPTCEGLSTAAFPTLVRAPVQYGPRIGAIGVYLTQQQLLPLARACEVMEDLLGVSMSEGTLCAAIERCAGNLREVEQDIKEALVKAEVLHQDETGLYVAGHRQWMHVACTPTLTHLCRACQSRARGLGRHWHLAPFWRDIGP